MRYPTNSLGFGCLDILPAIVVLGMAAGVASASPVSVIFDTDIENDVDDVGAVAMLHALADQDEVRILAMGVSVTHPWSAPCLDALNTWYGRPDVPIGVVKGKGIETGSKYAETIAREFPHDLPTPDAAPDAVALYRRVLAQEPDESVVLISVGFLTNIAGLLDSPADAAVPLSGVELVGKKVRAWVCMGCKFPEGREWNIFQDAPSSKRAIEKWPKRIVFSGFEIGESIQTGESLNGVASDSPVRRSYELFSGLKNRSSWDQTAVLFGVRGLDGRLAEFWDVHGTGTVELLPDGSNRWRDTPDGKHAYLVRKMPENRVAGAIEALMVFAPRKAAK